MDDAENKKKNCGRGIEYKRIWSKRGLADQLLVGFEFIENGEVHCANPLTFRPTAYYETDDKTAMCAITNEIATQLMDDLWKAGIRPTKTVNQETAG